MVLLKLNPKYENQYLLIDLHSNMVLLKPKELTLSALSTNIFTFQYGTTKTKNSDFWINLFENIYIPIWYY